MIGLRRLEEGAAAWGEFLRDHRDYVALGRNDPNRWARVLQEHDEAERAFQAGWRLIRDANKDMGNPLARRKTATPPAPDPARPALADPIVGDWAAGGGVVRITPIGTASFQGVTVKPYTFCRSGSVPLGQVEVTMIRTAPGKYVGTVRYYKVSNCEYIGEGQGATWEYRDADDTLLACSYSPNPSIPGGGCETPKRVVASP